MPQKTMAVTEKGLGFYKTRMLKAGDVISLPLSKAKLHSYLGYLVEPVEVPSEEAPKPRRKRRTAKK